jgi:adenine-specific DNA-methyltransferase
MGYPNASEANQEFPVADLVVVRSFGDAIYPALVPVDRVERGGPDKPWHVVINAENFHALQLLLYCYEGKVDAVYIDPPYNSGARDWKYNNDYVDKNDPWRHSKWLSMMQKRLKLAKRLLNPSDSVLIVTIDEKEFQRLALLLEQLFPGCIIQMVTTVINPKGTARYNEFSRVEEYVFFVFIGDAKLQSTGSDMLTDRDYAAESEVRWRGLARTGRKGLRSNNPGSWYPIFLKKTDFSIHSIGAAIGKEIDEASVKVPHGTIAVWPPTNDGHEYSWSTVPETLRAIQAKGGFKTGRVNPAKNSFPFYYLSTGAFEKIEKGEIVVTGRGPANELIIEFADGAKSATPRSVWNQVAHDAGSHGTSLLQRLLPGKKFPFPKSLYAVEDALRFFMQRKSNALILDFFGGSGTTTHAVARLNKQDGGNRRSILITNNEVSADEAETMRQKGLDAV